MSDYTMDDFRAEMVKRGVAAPTPAARAEPSLPHGTRTCYISQKCRCAACRAANSAYYHDLKARKQVAAEPRPHGNAITRVVPCGVHPLHSVKIYASGARSGCPMCEMQIEDLCRSMSRSTNSDPPSPPKSARRDHKPRINHEQTMIVGCSCGWRTPPGTTDSDTEWTKHAVEHMTVPR